MAKLVAQGGHSVELDHAVNTVGTDASNSIPIAAGLGLEAFHFSLTLSESGASILPAPNVLTLVNGSPLHQERPLNTGDTIQAGTLAVAFDGEFSPHGITSQPVMEMPLPAATAGEEIPVETSAETEPQSELHTEATTDTLEPVSMESPEDEMDEAPGSETDPSSPPSLFTIGTAGDEGADTSTKSSSRKGPDSGSGSLLSRIGGGIAIAAILTATGLLGWQNRGILASLGFGTRGHFHYVEKYSPADSLVAGSIKPVELYQSIVYHLSSMSDGALPFEPESLNEMMKAQAGVNIYDFDRISFAGDPAGTLTVVVTFLGDMPEQVREQIEMASEPRKVGPMEVYGSNLPDGRVAEVMIPDSKTIVAVLGSSFTELGEVDPSPETLSLIGQIKPAEGTIVLAGNIESMIDELPKALSKSGAPIPMPPINEGLAEAKKIFKDVDAFVFSMTLGSDTNTITTDLLTKPGAALDIGALTKMMSKNREEIIAKSGDVPEALLAQTNSILDSMKFSPRDGGMRFSMEITNDQIGILQEESQKARTAAMEAEKNRHREIQEKLRQEMQQAALEGTFEAN